MTALKSALGPLSLLRPTARLLAAVSGGADSVALLCGLHALRREVPFSLFAVHVEHGLRGAASQEDAAFVAELCQRLDVPLLTYHARLSCGMEAPGAEVRAREARQRFFAEALAETGADALLLAHHLDDQAETVLMRLLRGAGSRGLGGMRESMPFAGKALLRPFLSLPRQTLVEALHQMGQPWREDESNSIPCTLRNELRLNVFPLLSRCQPQAAAHMAQTAQRMQWDEDCLQTLAQDLLASASCGPEMIGALRREPLAAAPKALRLRALRLWVSQCVPISKTVEHALSHEDTLRLDALLSVEGKGSVNLPWALRALRVGEHLFLLRQDSRPLLAFSPPMPQALRADIPAYAFGSWRFMLSPLPRGNCPDGIRAVPLTESMLTRSPVLRLPQAADRMHPFGGPGGKPLRRYFTDHKVPAPLRAAWPVLAARSDVLWVPGVGASEKTRILPGADEPLFQLELQGELPLT